MMIHKSSITTATILMMILTYPINYDLYKTIRVTDFVAIFFVLWVFLNYKIRITVTTWLSIGFFALYFFSTVYGLIFVKVMDWANLFFIYKYCLPFLLLLSMASLMINQKQICFLIKWSFWIYLFLVFYVFIHIVLLTTGTLPLSLRPAFPLTFLNGEANSTDAHLYSAYLSNGFMAFILYYKQGIIQIKRLTAFGISTLSVPALILTGSRGGLVIFLISLGMLGLFIMIRKILSRDITISKGLLWSAFSIGMIMLVVFFSFISSIDTQPQIALLLERASNFAFDEDASASSRIVKNLRAIELVSNELMIIGIGLQSTEKWFDSSMASILVSSGLLGLIVFIMIIISFLYSIYREAIRHKRIQEYIALLFIFINYIGVNIITEFFLVTRSIVPFTIFIGLLYKLIQEPKELREEF